MTRTTQKQTQLLIPSHEVMSYFCYAYAKALLVKLKTLAKNEEAFKPDFISFGKGDRLTPVAKMVVYHLNEQIHDSNYNPADPSELHEFLALAEEFLAIFEA